MQRLMEPRLSTSATPQRLAPEDKTWRETCEHFLVSVPTELQDQVERVLRHIHTGGAGLRRWVTAIAYRGSKLPEHVPAEIIQVYMNDEEAEPLYDCETCGIAIPVRVSRTSSADDEPGYVYFNSCPVCGGRTGLYLYFSRQCDQPKGRVQLARKTKPK